MDALTVLVRSQLETGQLRELTSARMALRSVIKLMVTAEEKGYGGPRTSGRLGADGTVLSRRVGAILFCLLFRNRGEEQEPGGIGGSPRRRPGGH